jgi:hypothetical protein
VADDAPRPDVNARRRRGDLAACVLLLALGAAANVAYLLSRGALDLSPDEAFYWEWSRRLDLSYYEKGPLIAYIIAASRATLANFSFQLVGSEALAVRLPAVLLSSLTGLGIYALATATLRSTRLALAAVALTFTVPILAVGAKLMTIDTPMALCWAWCLVCLWRALRTDSLGMWIMAGVLVALGLLAKYTMVLIFPAVGLYLWLDPPARRCLRRPGPYVGALVALLGLVPIALWNARHGWVAVRHVAGQGGVGGWPAFDLAGPFEYLAGQAAVIGPVWFAALLYALFALRRRWREEPDAPDARGRRFLWACTVTPWLAFLPFSLITKIEPNWPVLAIITGPLLLCDWLAGRLRSATASVRRRARAVVAAGILSGAAMVWLVHRSDVLMPFFGWLTRGAPAWDLTPVARYDPSARLRGWSQLGRAVGDVLADERRAGREPFILAENYQTASEIAFYTPGEPTVYCAQSALGSRISQYDFWTNPIDQSAAFVGRPCLYVGSLHAELRADAADAPLPKLRQMRIVRHEVGGQPVQIWSLHVCDSFAGFGPEARRARSKY